MTTPDEFAEELLDLARSRPNDALVLLQDELAAGTHDLSGTALSIALRAGGLAARLAGDMRLSRIYLEDAGTAAASVGDETRAIEAAMSLAANEFLTGNPGQAAAILDDLRPGEPVLAARVGYQAATILARSGETSQAHERFQRVLATVTAAGDARMEAMTRKNLAMVGVLKGRYREAHDHITRALEIFSELELDVEVGYCTHNLGLIAAYSGDLPAAFAAFGEAERIIRSVAGSEWEVQAGHCRALIAAGLHEEAAAMAAAAAIELEFADLEADRAEILAMQAAAELAMGRVAEAQEHAMEAAREYAAQGRSGYAAAAEVTALRAGASIDGAATVATLMKVGMFEAALRAGIAYSESLEQQDPDGARSSLLRMARTARQAPYDIRLAHASALARALWAHEEKTRASQWAARGARVLDEYQQMIGISDARLGAGSLAAGLHEVGLASAIESGDNRRVFDWIERRAIASSIVRLPYPVEDSTLREALTELNALHDRDDPGARSRRRSLEAHIRSLVRSAAGSVAATRVSISSIKAALGSAVLVSYAVAGGRLMRLLVADGRSHLDDLGPADSVLRLVASIRRDLAEAAVQRQHPDLVRLQELDRVLRIGGVDTPSGLVVVAPAGIAEAPFQALPSLGGRPVTVVRSASAWLEHSSQIVDSGATVLIAGPDLDNAGYEIDRIASRISTAHVVPSDADNDEVLRRLDGAEVAHIVSHGRLRRDNPLFSSLKLHGGELVAYSLHSLARAPAVVVLSACHVGLGSGPGDSLLGLVDAFLSAGSNAVIASTLPVPDTRLTAELMAALHEGLAAGNRPATALTEALAFVPPTQRPLYQAAFTCFGAD